ncbi:adenylyl-sulfate reductase subunit alpha [bacterium]|nr:adenylyl-sulfate reductase subunit alpha [bacterium]MBU1614697.1 adenylyl-sulfate reductase subunit alpha [bacterium]
MALPNKAKGELPATLEPEVEEREVDILLVGGGMVCCGAAFEIKKWAPDAKILLIDKAAMERSGAVAQGLSAINTYLGDQKPEDYVRMVRNDLMGIVREDLIFDVGRHVDDSVHLFEEWGLPIWRMTEDGHRVDGADESVPRLRDGGKPARSGKWQVMINGESYKPIVAEAAKKAIGMDNILERVFIVKLLLDANEPNRIAGVVGFSTRENKIYVIKCKTMLVACGGAVNVFRPRSVGEGMGRAWYPVWNAGSTYAMCMQAGAEMTMMENRFVPARFKDGYGPVGAWFLLFKAKATNALGEDYMVRNKEMLKQYEPYGSSPVAPTCLRNHLMLHEIKEGRGPIYMDTVTALQDMFEGKSKKEIKHIETEAWEDFLDMTIGQAGLWAGMNIAPEKTPSELMPTEPYLLGSHSGCCGIWVSGPEDIAPDEWNWGYNRMTTVNGLFTAGDGVGASGHKFSSGSHAEGRITAKAMAKFLRDNKDFTPTLSVSTQELVDEIYAPVNLFHEHKDKSTDVTVNPNYITAKALMQRMVKITDEYGAGCSTNYITSEKMLERAMELLDMLKEDSKKMAAGDLHDLMRCWENYHRIWTVESHLRHILFRKESRYPGFYYRSDYNLVDEENWKCFVNSKYDPATGKWDVFKKEYKQLIS